MQCTCVPYACLGISPRLHTLSAVQLHCRSALMSKLHLHVPAHSELTPQNSAKALVLYTCCIVLCKPDAAAVRPFHI